MKEFNIRRWSAIALFSCCTCAIFAQTTWTGATSANWADPLNWSAGVPDAADDVTIPNVTIPNVAPVIMGGTAALAKSVSVDVSASLTINEMGSIAINGSSAHSFNGNFDLTTGVYNNGTISNSGDIILGSTSSVGQLGIWNRGTFTTSSSGTIGIDRSTYYGIYNYPGTFTNAGTIVIGALASVGYYGILSLTTFNNDIGGEIRIDRSGASDGSTSIGLVNSGAFTNAGKIAIGAMASVGERGLESAFGGTFNNTSTGEISIDRSTVVGWKNSGILTNEGLITIGDLSSVGNNGIDNVNTLSNAANGSIKVKVWVERGISNRPGVTLNNAGNIAITGAATGPYVGDGIWNQGNFNNQSGGTISVDCATYSGILNYFGQYNSGQFNNDGTVRIGQLAGTTNIISLVNQASFNNNALGEISLDRAIGLGLSNGAGTFTNQGKLTIGELAGVGGTGILNLATFNNSICSALIHIYSNDIISNGGTFSNSGRIIENASGNSTISSNSGVVQNLNGGNFIVESGNASVTFPGIVSACCPAGNILYVNQNATGLNDGTSWTNAYVDLQSALASPCTSINLIYVAEGTYVPTTTTDRNISFVMKNGISILGGFPNTGNPGLGDRNWATNVTILSGEIGAAGMADNSFNVVENNGTNNTAILDGFQILFGNANFDTGTNPSGRGGGIYNGDNSSPTIRNCAFRSNFGAYGGAIYNRNGCFPSFTNCTFIGNQSSAWGGACFTEGGSIVTFIHCSFSGNTGIPGVIYSNGAAVLKNSIVWGNGTQSIAGTATISNSIIAGGFAGSGNFEADPLFVSQPPIGLGTDGDLRLQECSPAIDAGNDADAPTNDLDKNARVDAITGGNLADMGAYEYQTASFVPGGNIWYVNAANSVSGHGKSWDCASKDLRLILSRAVSGDKIWVAEGTYKPTTGTDRTISFTMKNGVEILGGFPNFGNPGLSERNWVANVTTLSGEIGGGQRSFHVLFNSNNGLTSSAILDGFTITAGLANGGGINDYGAGMVNQSVSPTVKNCSFISNTASFTGGGAYSSGNTSSLFSNCLFQQNTAQAGGAFTLSVFSPSVANIQFGDCIFLDNTSSSGGGAVNNGFSNTNGSSNLIFNSCLFKNNVCHDGSIIGTGGALQMVGVGNSASSFLQNCLLDGNKALGTADDGGGAIMNYGGTLTVTNSTIVNSETARYGGAISNYRSSSISIVKNTIFSNNTAISGSPTIYNGNGGVADLTYCLIPENACPASAVCGAGNLFNVDPVFVSSTDFHLQICSPVIDAGLDANSTATTDLDGNTRKFEGLAGGQLVDMGAYEFQTDATPTVANCLSAPLVAVLDQMGQVTVQASALDNGSSGCSPLVFTISGQPSVSFNCSQKGSQTVTLTVTYVNRTSTCSATIEVVDNAPPAITCKPFTANLSNAGTVVVATTDVYQSGSDNCGVVNLLSVTPNTFGCTDKGPHTVVLAVNDGNGNASSCSAVVTVVDNLVPVAQCKNLSLTLGSNGTVNTNAAAVNNGSSDNCVNISLSLSKTSFNCSNFGPNTVVLTVTDNSSNSATCSSIITIGYSQPPVAKCKNAILVLSSAGNGSITAAGINNGSSDYCSSSGLTLSLSKSTYNCSNLGPNVVTLTVTNIAGSSSMCTGLVTVKDQTKPVAKCKAVSANVATGSSVTILASSVNNVSTDACTNPPNLSLSPNTFTCANAGPNTVVLTVSDASNNVSTCSAVVTITCGGPAAPEKIIDAPAFADYVELMDLFPNPVADKVNIRLTKAVSAETAVNILDNTGRVLYSGMIAAGSNQLQVDLNGSRFTSGIYLVSVKLRDRVQTKSLVIFKD